MKIAITGATGQLGRIVVHKLKGKVAAENIVALVRSTQKAADLGVEAREADYEKPETLQAAFNGVDTILLISSSEVGKRATQHQNVIDAAKQNGVKRIVYTSLINADTSTLSLAAEHVATEKALQEAVSLIQYFETDGTLRIGMLLYLVQLQAVRFLAVRVMVKFRQLQERIMLKQLLPSLHHKVTKGRYMSLVETKASHLLIWLLKFQSKQARIFHTRIYLKMNMLLYLPTSVYRQV